MAKTKILTDTGLETLVSKTKEYVDTAYTLENGANSGEQTIDGNATTQSTTYNIELKNSDGTVVGTATAYNSNTTYGNATTSASGLMSSTDKTRVNYLSGVTTNVQTQLDGKATQTDIDTAVATKSAVQIITWEADD